ncbi:MAG: nucleoside-diphosphate kinase [Patescibacteria group bacterium]
MFIEKTLVLLKTDAVQRGISGEIIHRFERAGLKIVGLKIVKPSHELAKKHYDASEEVLLRFGNNTLNDCKKFGIDLKANIGTESALEIGKIVWQWNVDFLKSGPVIALVLEGLHAIENVRMLCGTTIPFNAIPGSIRGDFSLDSAIGANVRKRTIYNLVHASGNPKEAEAEIKMWFKADELVGYKRTHEDLYNY